MINSVQSKRARLGVEVLEDRLTPSTTTMEVDLTERGSVGDANGALFRQYDAQPTGTGVINSFVRLQAPNAKTQVQQGYNTDARPLEFNENSSRQFTRSLQLGDIPEVNIGGVSYREFLLDINQKASQPYLSLDESRLFVGSQGNLTGYNQDTLQLAGLSPVFDLDDAGDRWVKLNSRLNQGSGKGDALIYIPSAAFAGYGEGDFVYLFSKFGVHYTGNAGFEEWAVAESSLTCDTGTIEGAVVDQDGIGMADVILFLDANNNGQMDLDEVYTTTDSSGHYAFHNLAAGLGDYTTYRVRQLVPFEYEQTSLDPDAVRLDDCGEWILLADFVNYWNHIPNS